MARVYPEKFEVLTKGDPQTSGGTPSIGFGLEQPLPENVIAASEEMRELVSIVRAIAPTQITVLLIGESGTGKEVFARLIHDLSPRRNGPFITVNCGAIPEGLIESELFGHERGAFTGAVGQRKGFFEAASGGTIFLDEIGESQTVACARDGEHHTRWFDRSSYYRCTRDRCDES
jgi:transcriptional regulator of acetoin/glycerol metabolism